jgi:hypothetical protein
MSKTKTYVQSFYIKDKKIVLSQLPQDLYDEINKSNPEYFKKIDNRVWIMPITSDDIEYYIVLSKDIESVEEFMHHILFIEEILK